MWKQFAQKKRQDFCTYIQRRRIIFSLAARTQNNEHFHMHININKVSSLWAAIQNSSFSIARIEAWKIWIRLNANAQRYFLYAVYYIVVPVVPLFLISICRWICESNYIVMYFSEEIMYIEPPHPSAYIIYIYSFLKVRSDEIATASSFISNSCSQQLWKSILEYN